jgi:acyl dehydratase
MASDTVGRITDKELDRIRARIGQGFPGRRPWRTEVTRDEAYHLAFVSGDLNPLYVDEEYADASVWGGLLAPCLMVNGMDTLRAPGSASLPQGLPGVHAIWTRSAYTFERPLRVGDVVGSTSSLKEVVEVESGFAGGRAVYQTYQAAYVDQEGLPLATREDTWIRSERQKTREAGKYQDIAMAKWTPDEIEQIFASYDDEVRTPDRTFAEVKVGEELPVVMKGPLTPTAEIAFEAFFGTYLVGNKQAVDLYRKHPNLMITNEQGVPEPPQRVHWDNQFARDTLGLPGAYDFGLERCFWLMQVPTNWMGDAAFVSKIEVQYRKFNYMGDVTYAHGRVTGAQVVDGRGIAEIDVWCDNQRGETTARGTVEVTYL